MDEYEIFEKRKSFTALSMTSIDQIASMEETTSWPNYRENKGTAEDYEDEFDDLDGDESTGEDYYYTVIFNGNAVLSKNCSNKLAVAPSPQSSSTLKWGEKPPLPATTTIWSHRDGDRNVDTVRYIPGGFVSVSSASTSCCCRCQCSASVGGDPGSGGGSGIVGTGSLGPSAGELYASPFSSVRSSRLRRRRPVLIGRDYCDDSAGTANLKKIKCLTRSIYLPLPNVTRKLPQQTPISTIATSPVKRQHKLINLDDFERNSIVTISYYGDEGDELAETAANNRSASRSSSSCELGDDEYNNPQSLTTLAEQRSSHHDFSTAPKMTAAACDDEQLNDDKSASTNTTRVATASTASGEDDKKNFNDLNANANSLGDETQYLPENKSHLSNELVYSSSAEDLSQPKELDLNEHEKRSVGSIERSYAPYKPKADSSQTNDFGTEIILKPKESDMQASSDQIDDGIEVTNLDDLDDDAERMRKIEAIAKARAAVPKRIGLSVKMF